MTDSTIARDELAGRLDEAILRQLPQNVKNYVLRRFVPVPTWNRFDLGFKLIGIRSISGERSAFADRCYEAHISAFSLGDMSEPGNEAKAGIDRFRDDFAEMHESLRAGGFDPARSLVPLASDGSLLNAGHRAGCAIDLGVPVVGVETELEPRQFDFRFFERRGMPADQLDAAAIRMVEAMPDAAVALLWPAARGRDREVERLIGPLVYRRAVTLTPAGGHVLLSRVYAGEPWLGRPEDDFPGIRNKLIPCFGAGGPLRVLVFDAPADRDRVQIKEQVRELFGVGKHSIHITDTHGEAVELAHLNFSPSARHFLDHGRPMAFSETRAGLNTLRGYMATSRLSPRDFAVDSGMVMGLYGLRPPGDIDVVAPSELTDGPVERHDTPHHSAAPSEILQDPDLHFRFAGISFVSLAEVAALKRRRLAGRDREDLLLISSLMSGSAVARRSVGTSLRFRFAILRLRRKLIAVTMALGFGKQLRTIYQKIFRR